MAGGNGRESQLAPLLTSPDNGSKLDGRGVVVLFKKAVLLSYLPLPPLKVSYATVLIDRVEELAEQQVVSKGQILGYAVAHELGHILMCSSSHPPRGLMRAGWKANELRDMAQRRLLFSAEEAERMRGRIAGILHH